MKTHLLFIFFLAAPLLGRLLSSDGTSDVDATEAASPKAVEVRTTSTVPAVPTATPDAKAAPCPSTDARPSPAAPAAPSKHAERRAARARALTFM